MRSPLLSIDGVLLYSTRSIRLFAYESLSIILMIYLTELGHGAMAVGILFTLALIGDTAISLWITSVADRIGRRRMLVAGSLLMVFAGFLFALTDNFVLLVIAATIGVISPSGSEVGPFLSIEQAALSQIVPDRLRTKVFAWYNLSGSLASALGALAVGLLTQNLQSAGATRLESYQVIVAIYAAAGLFLAMMYRKLSCSVELECPADPAVPVRPAAPPVPLKSRGVIFKLSAILSIDAFGSGFIIKSMMAYWFYIHFHARPAELGLIFFGVNIFAGLAALASPWVSSRIGLVGTMVVTHIPSNLLLLIIPAIPSLPAAVAVLLLRYGISQMDVPARHSYVVAIVSPEERSAAAGITNVARTVGSSISPLLSGVFLAEHALHNLPFFISGGLMCFYDLLLYGAFRNLKPPEEQ